MSYSPYLDQSLEKYNVRSRCEMCHFGGKLNSYGHDFKKQLEISHDIADSLLKVENLDSDNDGFNNLTEIYAKSLPGDKTSIPEPQNISGTKAFFGVTDKITSQSSTPLGETPGTKSILKKSH